MIATITEWTGRTGNNVIQLINCLYYAFYLHDFKKITFPQHPLFSTQTIISNNNSDDKKKVAKKSDNKKNPSSKASKSKTKTKKVSKK